MAAILTRMVRWDLWQGPLPERLQNWNVPSFNWRGWQASGRDQTGRFRCQILEPGFQIARSSLHPPNLNGKAPPMFAESWTDLRDGCITSSLEPTTRSIALACDVYEAAGVFCARDQTGGRFLAELISCPTAGRSSFGGKRFAGDSARGDAQVCFRKRISANELPANRRCRHVTQWVRMPAGQRRTLHFDYADGLTENRVAGPSRRFGDNNLAWDAENLQDHQPCPGARSG